MKTGHYKIRNPDTGEVYLERWSLNFGFFTLKLHHIWAEDFGRDLHDHPWWFVSLILMGGYRELLWRNGKLRWITSRVGRLVHRFTTDRHRIDRVFSPCWSMVLTGPTVRDWGFWTRKGFVPHFAYEASGTLERSPQQKVVWNRLAEMKDDPSVKRFQEFMWESIRRQRAQALLDSRGHVLSDASRDALRQRARGHGTAEDVPKDRAD